MHFQLDNQLINDCHQLAEDDSSLLLLHKNSLIPWFILVPKTTVKEIHQLNKEEYHQFYCQVKKITAWVEEEYQADKINIGSIGNFVPQIHFHIIARYKNDVCWPKPIWGNLVKNNCYRNEQIDQIVKKISSLFH